MARSKVNLVVLGFINQNPMHGYEIMQHFEEGSGHLMSGVKMPSIYKALQRLEKRGYILGEQVVEGNNPPKSVYTLTEEGKHYFKKILKDYLMCDEHVGFNFWMAIRFIKGMITKDYFLKVMEHRKELVEKFCAAHKNMKEKIEREHGEKIPFYGDIMLRMGRKHHELELETLSQMIEAAKLPENQYVFLQKEDE